MVQIRRKSVWTSLCASGISADRFLAATDAVVRLRDLSDASSLGPGAADLRGRSVLIATTNQIATALALIELDGIARQLVLCPPDLPSEHLPLIIDSVPVDAIVSDRPSLSVYKAVKPIVTCGSTIAPSRCDRTPLHPTEWLLLTSGTTGRPKLVVHDLATLTGGIESQGTPADDRVWSTFYDIRRYGGLQIFLRAVLTGGSLVLSDPAEPTADFLARAARLGVTHISGTPSHWRKAVMAQSANMIAPKYVRLSGEIADQSILDTLRCIYPQAKIVHAFASTEAGLALDVSDGLAGFPAALIGVGNAGVEMKVEHGSLRIRSARTAIRYLGQPNGVVVDAAGFVDTGDMLERRDDRYYFVGRRDGVINVGGLKVHPEEVEAVINRHPLVRMSLVRKRKSPITGAVVVADVALSTAAGNGHAAALAQEILELCRTTLPRHKVPASISFVNDLPVALTGKLVRLHA